MTSIDQCVTRARTHDPERDIPVSDDRRPIAHMIQIGTYSTRSEAERAQAALAMAGIPSALHADESGDPDALDLTEAARLLVDQADAEAAALVLSDAADNDGASGNDNEPGPA